MLLCQVRLVRRRAEVVDGVRAADERHLRGREALGLPATAARRPAPPRPALFEGQDQG